MISQYKTKRPWEFLLKVFGEWKYLIHGRLRLQKITE